MLLALEATWRAWWMRSCSSADRSTRRASPPRSGSPGGSLRVAVRTASNAAASAGDGTAASARATHSIALVRRADGGGIPSAARYEAPGRASASKAAARSGAYAAQAGTHLAGRTTYRGLLAIHAGKGQDDPDDLPDDARRTYEQAARLPAAALGAVVAVATLYGCHAWPSTGSCNGCGRPMCSPWAQDGLYHWQLRDVYPLAIPVPCRGTLGLWRLPEDVETALRAQISEETNRASNRADRVRPPLFP